MPGRCLVSSRHAIARKACPNGAKLQDDGNQKYGDIHGLIVECGYYDTFYSLFSHYSTAFCVRKKARTPFATEKNPAI